MSTQVAEEANLRLEDSLAGLTGNGSHMWCQGSLVLDFLACLRCSAAEVQFAFQVTAPLYRKERHSTRSCAVWCHMLGMKANAFTEIFKLSLFCPLYEHLPF